MQPTFAEVVERVENLSHEEKESLVEILQHRLAEERRDQLLRDLNVAEQEYEKGLCKPMTIEEFMNEVTQ